jgi:hypothetical protein
MLILKVFNCKKLNSENKNYIELVFDRYDNLFQYASEFIIQGHIVEIYDNNIIRE